MKKVPVGKSDGRNTFWIDEGWPENLPKAGDVAPIVVKRRRRETAREVEQYFKTKKKMEVKAVDRLPKKTKKVKRGKRK